jgi:hypothetical protein
MLVRAVSCPRIRFAPYLSDATRTLHEAQAVSRWLPTAAARVRTRVWSCGICGGRSGAGVGFLRVLWFPLPIFIPPIAPQSLTSSGASTIGQ